MEILTFAPGDAVQAGWQLDTPPWRGHAMYGESLFFMQMAPDLAPSAPLLFQPAQVLRMGSADRSREYRAGRDFVIQGELRRAVLTPGSPIPWLARAELWRSPGQEQSIPHRRGDPGRHLYFGEGHHFHDRQLEIDYLHEGRWGGAVPRPQAGRLQRSLGALAGATRRGEPFTICLLGDSISAGANASGLTDVAPHMPAYGALFAGALAARYGCTVRLANLAVGGENAAHAARVAPDAAALGPDLVIIAYGMNDVGMRDPTTYAARIAAAMAVFEATCPRADVMLVASMLGNPEWAWTPREEFPTHRDALAALCGPGVALADVTAVWSELLRYKRFHDLTGNGVNHPNDCGHRIYAQVLLEILAA